MLSKDLLVRWGAAARVLALTGAGVSAESGVPTFRGGGQTAVWKGMPFDQISSAQMARENLAEVWAWFDYRRGLLAQREPNPAHYALARWAEKFPRFTLVTQNIDGLHQRAGSQGALELHGNIERARCRNCAERAALSRGETRPESCLKCGGYLRPDVVLFGEVLPQGVFEESAAAARACELCFIVGTSGLIYPAAGLPEMARRAGAYIVEVNPERTPLTPLCHVSLRGRAGEILPLFC